MHAVQWDVANNPTMPDGKLMSFRLRALTPEGLKIAIAKQYRLDDPREVSFSNVSPSMRSVFFVSFGKILDSERDMRFASSKGLHFVTMYSCKSN